MILNPITNLHSMTNVGFAFHSPSLVQDCVSPQELLHCKIYREVDLGLKRPKRYSFSLECYFFFGSWDFETSKQASSSSSPSPSSSSCPTCWLMALTDGAGRWRLLICQF